jgi:argininosuccinate lyase
MLKGLPAGYQRDLQEDKPATLDALDTVRACTRAMRVLLDGIRFLPNKMEAAARRGGTTATEVADYLVRKGVPFREAHALAGRIVQRAAATDVALWELPLDEYRAVSPEFDADIAQVVTVEAAVESKDSPGGTSRRAVAAQLEAARERIRVLDEWLAASARALRVPERLAAE